MAVTPEMEQAMKKMNYPLAKVNCEHERPTHSFCFPFRPAGTDCGLVRAQVCDMPEDMRVEAMDIIIGRVEKYAENMGAACKQIKEQMDKKFGEPWHVVAGEGFGFTVQHEAKHLCYMFFGGTGRYRQRA